MGGSAGQGCRGRCGLRLEKEVFALESAGTTAWSSPEEPEEGQKGLGPCGMK